MKKLLAVLLALLLPLCALADTYECTLTVNADDAIFAQYAKENLMKIPGLTAEKTEKYAKVLHALLQNTKLTVTSQEDAMSFLLELAGGTLFDMTVHQDDTASYTTSSMLPGYALVEENPDLPDEPSIQELVDDAEMKDILAGMEAALSAWLADIEPTTTRGIFQGDAYDGGTQCTTWALSDQDIAVLVSALATDEFRVVAVKILAAMELDAAQLLKQFDDLNARVADEDAYLYILRLVHNDDQQLVGVSLSIMNADSQLATVSVGMKEQEVRMVVGFGLNNQNYWWECSIQGNQREQVQFLTGVSREWIADKAETFGYVKETNAPASVQYWTCSLTQSGERLLWDANLYEGETADVARKLGSSKGSMIPGNSTFEAIFTVNEGAAVPLEMQISMKPGDAIPPLDSSLTLCSTTSEEDAELYQELNKTLSIALSARLIKLVPLDVIMTLSEMLTPQ